jgi:hypothetical protein
MESEQFHPITAEEARSSLAEIDRIGRHIRKTIAAGRSAYLLILWGSIWIIGFGAEQFYRNGGQLWLWLDAIGIAASFFSRWRSNAPVKSPYNTRIGVSWLILLCYAALWCSLISPWEIFHHASVWVSYAPFMERKMALLWVTVCMFAYVMMGLWLDRFFLWLGGLVTLAAVLGFFFIVHYFYLWIAVAGGGSLIASGIFIRTSWR